MIHRNAMIATPETLYLADDVSCKLLDAATGEVRDEIVSTPDDGTVWKWLALADGVLYALVGNQETPDPTVRGDRRARGWPWGPPLGAGYNSKTYPWGFGQTILAIDPGSKKVLWRHREDEPLDTRAMCMAAGRIFFYSHGKFLGALAAKSGELLWRTSRARSAAGRSANTVSPRIPARAFPRRRTSNATTKPCTLPAQPARTWRRFPPPTASCCGGPPTAATASWSSATTACTRWDLAEAPSTTT